MKAKTILVADDEPSITLGVQFIMEEAGYRVIKAVSGPDALEITRNQKPDLILLDIMMPPGGKYEGIEVCKELKNDSETRHIPIIMLSAKGRKKDKQMAEAYDIEKFVKKPFDSDNLLAIIKEIFEREAR